jgi:hypothetical protein
MPIQTFLRDLSSHQLSLIPPWFIEQLLADPSLFELSLFELSLFLLRSIECHNTSDYLDSRGWYRRSPEDQFRVVCLCLSGIGEQINAFADQFPDELTRLEELNRSRSPTSRRRSTKRMRSDFHRLVATGRLEMYL